MNWFKYTNSADIDEQIRDIRSKIQRLRKAVALCNDPISCIKEEFEEKIQILKDHLFRLQDQRHDMIQKKHQLNKTKRRISESV